VAGFIERARRMQRACGPEAAADSNPGVLLGLIVSALARAGRDKLTIICSPPIATFAGWLEQLVAESTGKQGRGIVPVADELLVGPEHYGQDRAFVYVRLGEKPSPEQDEGIETLRKAGFPVVQIDVPEGMDLAAELFRWMIATAVASAELGVNGFDQPDVQASKEVTWRLADEYEATGQIRKPEPLGTLPDLVLYGDGGLRKSVDACTQIDLATIFRAHLSRLEPGQYFGVNAYLDRSPDKDAKLQRIRLLVRDRLRVATTLGYGPRFLHSTGQLHKGGPNTGLFLQITAADDPDIPVPGQKATFGQIKQFQAQGDFEVLCDRERRVLWVHIEADASEALDRLAAAVEEALAGL